MMVISMGVEQTNYSSQYIQLYPIIVTRNYINPCLGWNGILFFSVYVWTEDSSKVCSTRLFGGNLQCCMIAEYPL
jgi:hypothetical protein